LATPRNSSRFMLFVERKDVGMICRFLGANVHRGKRATVEKPSLLGSSKGVQPDLKIRDSAFAHVHGHGRRSVIVRHARNGVNA
jgi:hypothetical protein